MKLKLIKTEQEYDIVLVWIDEQFDYRIPLDSREGETLQEALLLVKVYEDEHYSILS